MVYEKQLWLKSYDEGVRPEIEISHTSLPDCLEQTRREFGNQPALHFLGVTFTFEQLMANAESALALREHDGQIWMHTGDIGRVDEDGYLTIVDRVKDMISVSGYKVFPREVEEILYEIPAIEICSVIGVPNPDRPETETVKLVVQRRTGFEDKSDGELMKEILAVARENFAPYKAPKIIEFRDVPLTAAGKVDKKALR